MAINKQILIKIKDKTKDDNKINKMLIDIIQFETDGRGWYKKDYISIAEKYMEEKL